MQDNDVHEPSRLLDVCGTSSFPSEAGTVVALPGAASAPVSGVNITISADPPLGMYPVQYFARNLTTGLVGAATLYVTIGEAIAPKVKRIDAHRFFVKGRGDVEVTFYFRYKYGPYGLDIIDIKPGQRKVFRTIAKRMPWHIEYDTSNGIAYDLNIDGPIAHGVLQMQRRTSQL